MLVDAWKADPKLRPDWNTIFTQLKVTKQEARTAKKSGVRGLVKRTR